MLATTSLPVTRICSIRTGSDSADLSEPFGDEPCRLPQWRVAWGEPKDLKAPPEIPEGAEWKHFPVD